MSTLATQTRSNPRWLRRTPSIDGLVRWWRLPTRYDLMVSYLRSRSLIPLLRIVVGGCAGSLAIVPVAMEFSPLGPHGQVWQLLDALVGVVAVVWMFRWWFGGLPTERTSAIFAVSSVCAICIACFADADKITGMCGLGALSLMAVYIGALHGARLITFCLGVSLAALTFQTLTLGLQQGWAVAAAKSVVTGALIIGMPPIFHLAQLALTNDAAAAMIDQLTGLHNRRGFSAQSIALAQTAQSEQAELSTIMVDIDKFKQINDTHGHPFGDWVIAQTASKIQAIADNRAVVGRIGGEEFCVAMIAPVGEAFITAERIRAALESMSATVAVTASIGVSTSHAWPHEQPASLTARLISEADDAMYSAKHAGGNKVSIRNGSPHS